MKHLERFIFFLFVTTLVIYIFSGHEYGVCCPASSKIKKPGNCPSTQEIGVCLQGHSCANDLQCPATLKCCPCAGDGEANTCVQPHNLTGRKNVLDLQELKDHLVLKKKSFCSTKVIQKSINLYIYLFILYNFIQENCHI